MTPHSTITTHDSTFPRTAAYHPDWILSGVSGGANPLWLTEWLTQAMDLRPGMRVLDLGCGRALSSIFLRREFGVEVWAADLWFNPSENAQRIRDAGVADAVFPLRADARALPFAAEFFDAIIAVDSFMYYGTDDTFLATLLRHLKPRGQIGIAGSGLTHELDGPPPEHLRAWWTPELACLHSPDWWRRHWSRSGIVNIERSDTLPNGWQLWRDWLTTIAPDNTPEIEAITADQGRTLAYTRTIAHRREDSRIEDPITSIPGSYTKAPLLRTAAPS